jgi:Fe2+ transport system protein FeoA
MNKQLADMGVSSGSIIEVESQALEDTVEVKVRGYHLTLTNDDAGRISVELHQ